MTVMDELQRLMGVYQARAAASVQSKLDVLMDLERVRDARVVPFLLRVLINPREGEEVRIHVAKQLRGGTGLLVPSDRPTVAAALGEVLMERSTQELRLQAALSLGDFTQIDGVLQRLSEVALAGDESVDLRYAAFTAIERAGPTPECIAVLRQVARDETLGAAARSVLSAWHTQ
jgi:hypothetical protein